MIPYHMYPVVVPFGNPNFDSGLGGSHDMDVKPPINAPVHALLPGTISDVSAPSWGKQVCLKLDTPYNGIPYMGYLHLSATNPSLSVGQHIDAGTIVGWVGGGTSDADYLGTSNPTGSNFKNDPSMSSQTQAGIALHRGPSYGGVGWEQFPPIDTALDPTPIIKQARSEAMASVPVAVQKLGRIGLFFGVDTFSWTTAQWQAAVQFCVDHRVNFAIIKVFEITQGEWYGGGFASIAKLFTDQGIQVLPYGFLYGGSGLSWEISMLEKYEAAYGAVCADMEGQWWWNNPGDGQKVAAALSGRAGLFFGSIPADPSANSFQPMSKVMLAMPMSYDDSLVAATNADMAQVGGMPVYPTLDLSNEFGPNNVLANARWASAYDQVSFWYYGFATQNPTLFDQAVAIIGSLPATGGSEMGLPATWTDDGTNLHNPVTPFVVTRGNRAFVLNNPWSENNVPLENEEGANPVEESNPALGGGTRQAFRGADGGPAQLEWTSAKGVFAGWVGPEILFLRKARDTAVAALAAANATLATVQAELAACQASGGTIPANVQAAINQAVADAQTALADVSKLNSDIQTFQSDIEPFVK